MHAKELLRMGESTDRILLLPVWREVPIYSEAERTVLELTEYVTKLSETGVPSNVYDRVRTHFDEKQIVDSAMSRYSNPSVSFKI
ncbi:carboxymuconolactone decarboxylase family protein [Paludifilum halophilum]|uniref:carboxymuconolactone decarboxylase family protein n=1 Tax=Paludifilum halophilum TaxID=1642702 RepID=UPI003083F39E